MTKKVIQNFEEAKVGIKDKLQVKKGNDLAQEAAMKFSLEAYKEVDAYKATKMPAIEIFKKLATAQKITLKTPEPFKENERVKGFGNSFAKDVFGVTQTSPISDPISGENEFYVACYLNHYLPYIPKLNEEGVEEKIKRTLKREKSLELTKKDAQKILDEANKEIIEKKTFNKISMKDKFKDIDAFTQKENPKVPNGYQIKRVVKDCQVATFASLVEGYNGYTIVYLDKVENPLDADFEKQKDAFSNSQLSKAKQEAVKNVYDRLEKESDTKLSEKWQTDSM